MPHYAASNKLNWTGRKSDEPLYVYQKMQCIDLDQNLTPFDRRTIALLGYACDEGVRRNQGRVGAKEGPNVIRQILGGFADHMRENSSLIDFGDVVCDDENLERAHELITHYTKKLLDLNCFPILLGGGHDLAYAHFRGITKHFADRSQKPTIGIINLDAHFDLRQVESQRNSGTPFFQLAQEETDFHYLCLGIQQLANNKQLYATARQHGVNYMDIDQFQMTNWQAITELLDGFISSIDYIYLTIDLDGFSSAYAPGVSASSPMGFDPAMVQKVVKLILTSQKLISADVVELNPSFDKDNQTARLAAGLVYQFLFYGHS